MENERKTLIIAVATVLANLEAWYESSKVWLYASIHERESMYDPSRTKPQPVARLIRQGWQDITQNNDTTYNHYQLLMSNGRPMIRIIGQLSNQHAPISAVMQYQIGLFDLTWQTVPSDVDIEETLLAYANTFNWERR